MRPPRYPRAIPCAGFRSAPAGYRPATYALPRRDESLPRSGGASGRAWIRFRPGVPKDSVRPLLRSPTPPVSTAPPLLSDLRRSDTAVGRRRGENAQGRLPLVDDAGVGI